MRYGAYNDYGNYNDYGRRGVPGTGRRYMGRGRYRGNDVLEDMQDHYANYSESRNYGDKNETMQSLDYMLKSVHQFMNMLKEDANSQEEMQLIQEYARKIGEM